MWEVPGGLAGWGPAIVTTVAQVQPLAQELVMGAAKKKKEEEGHVKKDRQTDTHTRKEREHHVTSQAETSVMHLRAKDAPDGWHQPEAARFFSRGSGVSMALSDTLTSDSSLQNSKRIHFSCFQPPACGPCDSSSRTLSTYPAVEPFKSPQQSPEHSPGQDQ